MYAPSIHPHPPEPPTQRTSPQAFTRYEALNMLGAICFAPALTSMEFGLATVQTFRGLQRLSSVRGVSVNARVELNPKVCCRCDCVVDTCMYTIYPRPRPDNHPQTRTPTPCGASGSRGSPGSARAGAGANAPPRARRRLPTTTTPRPAAAAGGTTTTAALSPSRRGRSRTRACTTGRWIGPTRRRCRWTRTMGSARAAGPG